MYRPIQGQEQLCPRELLKKLCCNCKTDCSTRRCCCKQVWLDDAYSRDRDVVGRYHVLHHVKRFKNNETNAFFLPKSSSEETESLVSVGYKMLGFGYYFII